MEEQIQIADIKDLKKVMLEIFTEIGFIEIVKNSKSKKEKAIRPLGRIEGIEPNSSYNRADALRLLGIPEKSGSTFDKAWKEGRLPFHLNKKQNRKYFYGKDIQKFALGQI